MMMMMILMRTMMIITLAMININMVITMMMLSPNTMFYLDNIHIYTKCIIYSLLNDKSLESTIMENQNTIGYNIGGKILTYAALKSLALAKVL
jgi:hypothetical protein